MTTQISGDTGVSRCQPNSVSQDDLLDGVVGKGPAFRCQASVDQSISGLSKIIFGAETYDTAGALASSTFTAPVAGYYTFHAAVRLNATSWSNAFSFLFKNGTQYSLGSAVRLPSAVSNAVVLIVGDTILLAANDTVEIYCTIDGTSQIVDFNDSQNTSHFSGFLARAA